MSLKRLNGWEPRTETVYEYDGDRLVRSVTTTEVEWDQSERDWALALLTYESDKCPGCGGSLTETTSAESYRQWKAHDPLRCHKCTALGIAQDKHMESDGKPEQPQALLWNAERI